MTDAAADTVAVAAELLELVRERGWTIGVAESLTGGLVTATIVAVPGASASLRGGIVSYATDLKHALLGVDEMLLAAEGAVHPEVARQMAAGARSTLGKAGLPCDVGLATTGVAGPDPQDGNPPGTVHIAVSTPAVSLVESLSLTGTRPEIREEAVRRVILLAVRAVSRA